MNVFCITCIDVTRDLTCMPYKCDGNSLQYLLLWCNMIKHDKETVKDRHIFSHQECGCINCYRHARDILIAELESLCIIDIQKEPNLMRLSEKFADALPNSENADIPHITNEDIWGTLIMRFNQTAPDAIQDYGIIIRMVIDALIDSHRNNTTNKHGGDMYGV